MSQHHANAQGKTKRVLVDFPDGFAPRHAARLPLDQINQQQHDGDGDQNDKVLGGVVEGHEDGGQFMGGNSAINSSGVGIGLAPACTSPRI